MKTLKTWCGSRVTVDRMPLVLQGWQSYARKLERELVKRGVKRMHGKDLCTGR
jgi:hypothetical protein